ncbi:MAG: NAD(P)-binding domain-containing protein [Spirochaetaceae bacterium]|nr:NAD(P)-binding domain-containing protein [Spirochaetaceae bacterium]
MNNSIGFIGAGNMGGAIIRGLLSGGTRSASDLIVSDPMEKSSRNSPPHSRGFEQAMTTWKRLQHQY